MYCIIILRGEKNKKKGSLCYVQDSTVLVWHMYVVYNIFNNMYRLCMMCICCNTCNTAQIILQIQINEVQIQYLLYMECIFVQCHVYHTRISQQQHKKNYPIKGTDARSYCQRTQHQLRAMQCLELFCKAGTTNCCSHFLCTTRLAY